MKELLLYMAKSLVDDPERVEVREIEGEDGGTTLELHVAPAVSYTHLTLPTN